MKLLRITQTVCGHRAQPTRAWLVLPRPRWMCQSMGFGSDFALNFHRQFSNHLQIPMTPTTANNSVSPEQKPSQPPTMAVPPRPIRIFDTTLRDGEQSPGCSMNLTEKLEVAQALVDLGVDVIEAGFPIASPGDFEAVRANRQQHPRRDDLRPGPLQRRTTSTAPGKRSKARRKPRIHVFLATSAIHREFKLKMDKDEIIAPRRRRREAGRRLLRRHRVLARRRRPHRARFSLPGRRSGHRRRRHDGQHSRHGRLRHAGALWAASFARCANACRTSTRP